MRAFAEKVKGYYELGLWSEQRVRDAVAKKRLYNELCKRKIHRRFAS